jgi:CBS-domain-containing membrane protein
MLLYSPRREYQPTPSHSPPGSEGIMDHPLRRPEEILAYRSLKQILAAKPRSLWTVGPKDNALAAMRLMADKNIGLVLVVEHGAIAGILSERDCVRRLVLAGKSPELTPVADIMVRDVIKIDLAKTFADCLKLMHLHGIRHLRPKLAKPVNSRIGGIACDNCGVNRSNRNAGNPIRMDAGFRQGFVDASLVSPQSAATL